MRQKQNCKTPPTTHALLRASLLSLTLLTESSPSIATPVWIVKYLQQIELITTGLEEVNIELLDLPKIFTHTIYIAKREGKKIQAFAGNHQYKVALKAPITATPMHPLLSLIKPTFRLNNNNKEILQNALHNIYPELINPLLTRPPIQRDKHWIFILDSFFSDYKAIVLTVDETGKVIFAEFTLTLNQNTLTYTTLYPPKQAKITQIDLEKIKNAYKK